MSFYRISIPLQFNGLQPSSFGVSPASSKAFEAGSFIGSVEKGGSCNCEEYHFIPHCSGTHTESIAHILIDKIPVWQVVPVLPVKAYLLTVFLKKLNETTETYSNASKPDDLMISSEQIINIPLDCDALIIRTLPNLDSKKHENWDNPPYFTTEAMKKIANFSIKHLLVDVPSVDRAEDDGLLLNHRIWWNIPLNHRQLTLDCRKDRTISEMVFVDSEIPDGLYSLQMMVPHFDTDAAPAQLILF